MGKTGKEGLKRRCLELEPRDIHPGAGARAKEICENFDLDDVRDVSAGAATFYVWVCIDLFVQKQYERFNLSIEINPNPCFLDIQVAA